MNLYQKSSFSPDTRIISPLGKNKYRVMKLNFINNTTNFHGCSETEEIIELTDEEFKEFKKIELRENKMIQITPNLKII